MNHVMGERLFQASISQKDWVKIYFKDRKQSWNVFVFPRRIFKLEVFCTTMIAQRKRSIIKL